MTKWLSWSLVDPQTEIGGAEIHAMSVGHHLHQDFGVDFTASNDPLALFDASFDVIQTHGSALPKKYLRRCFRERWRRKGRRPLRIHTLHGDGFEIIKSLRAYHKVGRWKALWRECKGILGADHVFSVRDKLPLLSKVCQLLGRPLQVIENGWDTQHCLPNLHRRLNAHAFSNLLEEAASSGPFLLFVGRSQDPQKAFHRIQAVAEAQVRFRIFVAPGTGVAATPWIRPCGALSPQQLSQLYQRAHGLLLPSVFEGLPLVLLEALAQGCPALVSDIPAHRSLEGRGLKNFYLIRQPESPHSWLSALSSLESVDGEERQQVALHNRQRLKTWAQVATEVQKASSH